MAFELTIDMVGLCLFVTDAQAEAVYIALPSGELGHHIDPHAARLVFDSAYLQPGSERLENIQTLVPLDRTELDLLAAAQLIPGIPETVANVGAVTKRPVLRDALVGDDPGMLLAARAVLRSGAATAAEQGSCWDWPTPDAPREMSHRVRWTVGQIEGDELNLTLTALAGGTTRTLPPLFPIDGGIQLELYYTPRDELPPAPYNPNPPQVGEPAHHFAAFYDLFDPPMTDGPLPLYVGLSCNQYRRGGSPYTCMAAQSPPTP